ncbi:Beta-1,3-galactosyltransferase brn [Trachymyrmex zeteki]|uniref:Hexosyltransferase n=1 Tax=Mycetomoellerius zeteki TaxID=64791 RepID=A0A151X5P0_9HYME|nr:PREDICTED: beta-1,3-galactosyltransferase brn [Trachymyrmex zeteki]KYQ55682.1 Beta-1,3-galactosyltransferase brn [Trachymyrmex zeteki]
MCCYLLQCYLFHLYFQRGRRNISRVKLGYVLWGIGMIALLEFFGAFVHIFEVTYDEKNFVYPYKGNVHEFVNALRRNEKPEVEPINEYKYAFILTQPQKCKENADDTLRIVYIVKSAIENFDRRTAIRNSWGIEKRFFDVPTRTIFVVGTHRYDQEVEAKLKLEAGIYKDIVQADFIDSYYNNTIKTMMSFKWLVNYCPNSKFYMFVDDDMYVSVKNLATFIRNPANYPFYLMESRKVYSAHKREIKQSDLMDYSDINFNNKSVTYDLKSKTSFTEDSTIHESTNNNSRKNNMHEKQEVELNENRKTENEYLLRLFNKPTSNRKRQLLDFELPDDIRLFAGFVFMRSAPHRHKFSKWYVTLKEYPYHLWPPYVTAGAYVLSKEALLDLYYTSFYTKHFKFDDIFLGLVAKKADIVPFHCEEFHFYKKAYTKHSYTYVITSHGYGDPNELLQIWNEQKALGNA